FKGTLISKEEQNVTLALEYRAGQKLTKGFLMTDEGFLIEQMQTTMLKLSERNPLGMYLLREGCRFATDPAAREGEEEILEGTEIVLEKAFTEPITLIWGPPGTGKTYTIARLCQKALTRGVKVLVVSYANVAVDAAALQLASTLRSEGQEYYLKEKLVVRFGNIKDQRVLADQDISLNMEAQEGELDISRQMRIRIALEQSQVIFTTIAMASQDVYRSTMGADMVIFDEVSMAYVPQIFQAACLAQKHLVLVGDHRQLPPITVSKAKDVLSRDIFYSLGVCDEEGNVHPHPWLVMLSTQRRMYPEIASFSSKTFYGGLLKNHPSMLMERASLAGREPFPGCAISMLDLSDCFCVGAKSASGSHYNLFSAMASLAVILACHKEKTESVGVVTPYTAQVGLLQSMLGDAGREVLLDTEDIASKEEKILVASVHSFQGSERDVIVFDTVDSYPSSRPGPGIAASPKGDGPRLTNVAITRARGKLVTVTNSAFWLPLHEQKRGKIAELVMHVARISQSRNQEGYLSTANQSLPIFLLGADYGGVLSMHDKDTYLPLLLDDIEAAKKEIILFIPPGAPYRCHPGNQLLGLLPVFDDPAQCQRGLNHRR
ncbi:MAG: AAA family ATPase, partial [Blautia sp.]|nr:AAA family ATPase [Blautia sp.]